MDMHAMLSRRMLKSKIHRARVTHADLSYEGSITLSPELLRAADILDSEAVHIWNVTSGTRFETYAMKGQSGSRSVCVNGAAAHLVTPGDIIIIASFVMVGEQSVRDWIPTAVFVDEFNQIKTIRREQPTLV
jgi:aspartate 1-decarboxylase